MIRRVALAAVLGLVPTAVAVAAGPAISGPARVRVGETVTVKARDLIPAHYRLYIGTTIEQGAGARPISCLAPIGPRVDVPSGDRTFRGRVPAKLTCYQGVRIGTFPTGPGQYRFTVASPLGGDMFAGGKSFATRAVRIVG